MSIFSSVALRKPARSTHKKPYRFTFSFEIGQLIPIHLKEHLPSAVQKHYSEQMVRFAPMLAPMMDNCNVWTYHFKCPYRLVWSRFPEFISNVQPMPVFPFVTISHNVTPGSLCDYLGIEIGDYSAPGASIQVSAIPFAIYNFIFNEYFRDENLQSERFYRLSDGDNTAAFGSFTDPDNPNTQIHYKNYRKDYFTGALPFAQKGEEVTIPLGTTADLVFDPAEGSTQAVDALGVDAALGAINLGVGGTGVSFYDSDDDEFMIDVTANTKVDLTSALAATINSLRSAFAVQGWLEKNARGGTRPTEIIFAHFFQKSSDARLQRPELLATGKSPVVISEVLQTSSADAQPTPQGNMSGHGLNLGSSFAYKTRFEEHMYTMSFMCVCPEPNYMTGIEKHWFRKEPLDFAWPSFAHLGEQEVLVKELYAANPVKRDDVFGYQSRYAEYKWNKNRIAGEFHTTMDYWHMAMKISDVPSLSQEFIQINPVAKDLNRIFAVPGANEHLYAVVHHTIEEELPLPYWGIPSVLS